jgi:Icc protein
MQSVRLIQYTDMHLFGDAAGRLRGVATLPALQAAIADAQRRCSRPDGILLTGDLVQDDPDGYRWFKHIFGGSQVPVLCPARQSRPARPHAGCARQRAVRSLASSAVRPLAGRHARLVARQQRRRRDRQRAAGTLRETLRAHRNQHVLLCLHHQPIAMRSDWLDQVGLTDSDEFMA